MNKLTLMSLMAACLICAAGNPLLAQSAPGSVEELPIERFDEYVAGSLPPPWRVTGALSDKVTLSLQPAGESPFVGNVDTGKGVVVQDASATAGRGVGVAIAFRPPPAGQLYVGYDFKISGDSGRASGLDYTCELTDIGGQGLRIRMGGGDGQQLVLEATKQSVPVQILNNLKSDSWYHVAVDCAPDGTATLTLTEKSAKKNDVRHAVLPTQSGSVRPAFGKLAFFSAGADAATGSWALDNICMAGEVSAPRDALLPFVRRSLTELKASPRKVFAYYYEIYPATYSDEDPGLGGYVQGVFNPTITKKRPWLKDRVEAGTELLFHPLPRPRMQPGTDADEMLVRAMEDEVRVALQIGLDGFLLDFFAYPQATGGPVTFNKRSFSLMNAAGRVDPAFKIIPAVYTGKDDDGSTLEQQAEKHARSPVLLEALRHPQALKLPDGRVAFSMWGTERRPPEWWGLVVKNLEAQGVRAAFIGQFNGMSRERLQPYAPVCAGMADWGPRSPIEYHWVERVRDMTPLVVSPVAMQDVRTRGREYWESCGSDTLRKTWMAAIEDKSDWVFLTTWSDYTEQAMAPSTAIGFMPHDINTYYTQWFKTGQQPAITRDVLYYTYRRHHADAKPARGGTWKMRKAANIETRNDIELLAFLKEPGKISIQIEGQTFTMDAPAGITSFKVPMPADRTFVPTFALERAGRTVVSGQGRYAVLGQIEYANFLYHAGVIAAEK